MAALAPDALLRLRARAQGLDRASAATDVAGAIAHSGGLQAQDRAAAALGVRARSHGLTAADIDAARADGTAVVTWCMRGTLHLVAAEDARWLVSVTAPASLRVSDRRLRQLGIDADAAPRCVAHIAHELAESGPRTRAELGRSLVEARLPVDPRTQSLIGVLHRAALLGEAVLILRADGQEAFARAADVLPDAPAPQGEAALAELARRHLRAFGPAAPEDLRAWSKLGAADVRRAWSQIETELEEVGGPAGPLWRLRGGPRPPRAPSTPVVRLLGAYDGALLGHADRALLLAPEHRTAIQPGGGIVHPAALVDGRVVARWRRGRDGEVAVEPFTALPAGAQAGLDAERADLARFLTR